ncbi:unnamed protein product [Danaus chrysippus]|uniref:(African queen) hypothetical protein n=1 Tax=Danaus chrysippus TaxID=151541 RepID=A0A8J2W1E9_9NEOP|nr:unnamed protein product [Danaus chrysippus]
MRSILILVCLINFNLACRPAGEIEQSGGKKEEKKNKTQRPKFFSNQSWGGWIPPDDSWKKWVELWGQENTSMGFDSTEDGRNPEDGWPTYWKGLGKGNSGVPPPPWAYIPENYGRPEFCYLLPVEGNCNRSQYRWGFNPTINACDRFLYSGCGGNENNFMNRRDCDQACGQPAQTDCDFEAMPKLV